MKRILKTILLLSIAFPLFGQDSLKVFPKTIGIEYFGELAFHPGLRCDFGIPFWINTKLKGKKNRVFIQQLVLRPKIGYFHLPRYTHNLFLGTDLNLRFESVHTNKQKHFLFESFLGIAYQRYQYIGRVYQSTNTGSFTEKKFEGGNAMMLSSGFLIGGSLPFRNMEWILGIEYFLEFSEDKLIIQHPTGRLGVRVNLKP